MRLLKLAMVMLLASPMAFTSAASANESDDVLLSDLLVAESSESEDEESTEEDTSTSEDSSEDETYEGDS